jgi:hypothetical protein
VSSPSQEDLSDRTAQLFPTSVPLSVKPVDVSSRAAHVASSLTVLRVSAMNQTAANFPVTGPLFAKLPTSSFRFE